MYSTSHSDNLQPHFFLHIHVHVLHFTPSLTYMYMYMYIYITPPHTLSPTLLLPSYTCTCTLPHSLLYKHVLYLTHSSPSLSLCRFVLITWSSYIDSLIQQNMKIIDTEDQTLCHVSKE